jgi:hypothetical protein
MFLLSDSDLGGKMLGCADGPAGFNAGMTECGYRVVSCDPLYQFSEAQIRKRIDETYDNIIAQTYQNLDRFVWTTIPSVEELGRIRRLAMNDFLADYDRGKRDGRYIAAELQDLPFADGTFDLAVCSHFLFLYSPILSLELHERAIDAMCDAAKEVRIFPLLTYDADPSPYVDPIVASIKKRGRRATIEHVQYEFQRGGNQMLRIVS